MEPNEQSKDTRLNIDRDAQINVVVNRSDADEMTIDLGRVFHNMKVRRRVFAWVLVLCLLVGLSAPLVMYQLNRPMLTVTSAVTLNYQVPMTATTYEVDIVTGARIAKTETVTDREGNTVYTDVRDLTAPDGSPLNLNLIKSATVLQQALSGMALPEPISLSALQNNIVIERVLTDDSRRAQELAEKMVTDKSTSAYEQIASVALKYDTVFTVRLVNGFGDEDSGNKVELSDADLALLLDRILIAYNDSLVRQYADIDLPGDEIAVIEDADNMDILESLERLRTALNHLYDYCDGMSDTVKEYRSFRDGRNLNDWMVTVQTVKETTVDYLYSYVYNNSIVRQREAMITNYDFQLRQAQTELDTVTDNIATVQAILDSYKNDEIFVSMQESDASKATKTTTDYYNELVLQQAENYDKAAELETTIADLNDKIARLKAENNATQISEETIADVEQELAKALAAGREAYDGVMGHLQELTESTFYTTYAEHTIPQGKVQNFLTASLKKMLIGAAVGIVIACGLWFLAGLAPEFRRNRKPDEDANGKEANG